MISTDFITAFRVTVIDLVRAAGFTVQSVTEIQNQYRPNDVTAPPWLHIATPAGVLEVGPRGQVIHLSWRLAPGLASASGGELFATENVTVEETFVHAWSPAKLSDYLKRLHDVSLWQDAQRTRQARIHAMRDLRERLLQVTEEFRRETANLNRDLRALASTCDHLLPDRISALIPTAHAHRCAICGEPVY